MHQERVVNYRKKIIGTVFVLVLLVVGVVGFSSTALANFLAGGRSYIFDGVITAVSGGTATVQTDGTSPITLTIPAHTLIAGGTLAPGEEVKVIAIQQNGQTVARIIRIISSGTGGYGTTGSGSVLVDRATVVSFSGGTLVLTRAGVTYTFQTNSSTHFLGGTLSPGDTVFVAGSDTGSGFLARSVFKLRH